MGGHGRESREPKKRADKRSDAATDTRSRLARRHSKGGGAGGPTISDVATAAIESKDAGTPVDSSVAAAVGAHLAADLSRVRVHSDANARIASAAIGARAFAHRSDVFLGPGERGTDLGLMAHELTHVVQQGAARVATPQRKVEVGPADSPAEREADGVAAAVTGNSRPAQLLVDDGPVASGQMLKSTFFKTLRAQVTAVANEELGIIYSAIGCPYIQQYFDRYERQPASAGQALLERWVPALRQVRTAADMIPLVLQRVRIGVRAWRETGEPPADLADADPGAADAARATAGGEDQAQALRAPGGEETLASLEASLGEGQPLASDVASRMSSALDLDVSAARIHTSPVAAAKAAEQGALAFTVGPNIVMGAGAPAAGTLEGDALLAHELVHTNQQRDAAADPAARRRPIGREDVGAEDHADVAVATAAAATTGERSGLLQRLGGGLRTGLQLQRCKGKETKATGASKRPIPLGPATPKPELHTQRFDGDKKLDAIAAGSETVKAGDEGLHVRKVQQALADLGLLGADKVTGKLDADTQAALKAFQHKAKIAESGVLDAATLDALKKSFDDMSRYREMAYAPAIEKDGKTGTRTLTDEDRKAIEGALNPQVETEVVLDVTTGKTTTKIKEPKFVDPVGGKSMENRLREFFESKIKSQYNSYAKGKAADRKDPKKMFSWPALESLGAEAWREVQTVFGGYTKGAGAEIKRGTVLEDRWEIEEERIKKSNAAGKHKTARWRIQKIMNEVDEFKEILKKHGALSTRDPEKGIIEKVHDELATKFEAELLEIHKGWGGAQGGGKIYLQRYRGGSPMADRLKLWRLFQTVIHEYLHSLTDKKYADYADRLGDPSGHTLREGMTDFFTKIVWSGVAITEELRQKIEGPDLYDVDNPVKIPALDTYDETAQAEQLTSIVGFHNVCAAYFQGAIELIGKK